MSARVVAGREIARGLLRALRPALEPAAPAAAVSVARDVAQVMGLAGLDAALGVLERLRDVAAPVDLAHVVARLSRLAEQAAREESAVAFVSADGELAALARALEETDWVTTGGPSVAVYPVTEVLADLPLEPNPDFERARLSAPVAASLRAALEWIGADEALLVQGAVHDSALALTCPAAHTGGIGPAGAVLASIEGSLGPEPDGRWTLRVPLHAERPSFLLLRLGHVPVALPWHAVARLRMLPPGEWAQQAEPVLDPLTTPQAGAEERPGALVALGLARAWLVADRIVWRIATTPEDVHERGPLAASTRVVPVDNGERYWVLEPAWLLRATAPLSVEPPRPMPRRAPVAPAAEVQVALVAPPAGPESVPAASPADAAPPPGPASLADAVARAIECLRAERAAAPPAASPSRELPRPAAVTPPPSRELPRPAAVTPPPSRELPRPAAVPPPSRDPSRSASTPPPSRELPRPGAPPASRELPRPAASPPPTPSHAHLTVLRPEDVVAHGATTSGPTATTAPSSAPPPAPPRAAEPRSAGALEAGPLPARRALVADDSLVARIFLARLLERRGFVVELVGDGEGMWEALRRGPWSLVCADVTMPDSYGRAHLERLLDFRAACREPFRLVALTRDDSEERDATLAGASLHLRKPFDPATLDELLDR